MSRGFDWAKWRVYHVDCGLHYGKWGVYSGNCGFYHEKLGATKKILLWITEISPAKRGSMTNPHVPWSKPGFSGSLIP